MFTKSIRWRLNLWLGFLLICALSGFGVTVYQLQRINQFNRIDEELQRRLGILSSAVRRGPPPEMGPRRGPGAPPPGVDLEDGPRRPPPPRERPGGIPPGLRREMLPGAREINLPLGVASLFEETGDFYFTVWSREGAVLKRTT